MIIFKDSQTHFLFQLKCIFHEKLKTSQALAVHNRPQGISTDYCNCQRGLFIVPGSRLASLT